MLKCVPMGISDGLQPDKFRLFFKLLIPLHWQNAGAYSFRGVCPCVHTDVNDPVRLKSSTLPSVLAPRFKPKDSG